MLAYQSYDLSYYKKWEIFFNFVGNLQKRKCDSASLFLFDNESKFVLWSNDSFKRIITIKYKWTEFLENSVSCGRKLYDIVYTNLF